MPARSASGGPPSGGPAAEIGRGLDALLRQTVAEAASLLAAEGGMVYLFDPSDRLLHLAYDVGVTDRPGGRWAKDLRLPIGSGLYGLALATGATQMTSDYGADARFPHTPDTDRVVAEGGIRSMVVAPMFGGDHPLGALGVFSGKAGAFSEADAALIRALANHAAIAIANARLIEELDRSRAELAAAAEAERSLREIAADLARIREPGRLLQRVVDDAKRLVGADGAILALLEDDGVLHWRYDDGLHERFEPAFVETLTLEVGIGVTGRAVSEGRAVICNHDLIDAFPRSPESDHFFEASGFRSMIGAPIVGEAGPLGALEVYARREDSFDEADAALIRAFADQAAIALANARLIDDLARSRSELTWRAEAERSLREMAGRLAAIRDPATLLQDAVEAAARLPGADWAELAIVTADGRIGWAYDAGLASPVRDELRALPLRVGEGLLGRSAAERRVLVTGDYLNDTAFVHSPEADEFTRRAGFRSLVAAPFVTDDGVIGVLGVHSSRPNAFDAARVSIVEAFADHASVAMSNARLIEELDRSRAELAESEARYRHLVKASPDVIWAVDAEGIFTFLSDRIEPLTGFPVEELLGRHFAELTIPDSVNPTIAAWEAVRRNPLAVYPFSTVVAPREGTPIPVEIWATGMVHDGVFAGAHGSIRDMRERERLEGELQTQAAELAAGRERAHLARELHDSVTQALFSMTLVSRSIELLLDRDPSQVRAKLGVLRELQADALAEMRALIFELRPASLETDGLLAALRTHVAAVEGRTGLTIVVESPDLPRLPPEIETALFRVAQEALHNVVKHAGARRVRLAIEPSAERLRLTVEDDGCGFDPASVRGDHLGLAGMRARVEKLAGRLEIVPEMARGTRIVAEVPLPR